ncbi:hypothetical protein GYMLUDRAFT_42424 [Collybiopsis luxurians FD-317 M1]|uniref:N-acetyltransferase domain-containing protein n=1 Tax=Collybiopsis luxurians FD-317 M1 TaxID=944289 RepID=A0A0D0BE44_9AGAR|nr:hypothetical protein GYMLUDRAFT_42424 [Collybiopsis luxurians FD-317 M1]
MPSTLILSRADENDIDGFLDCMHSAFRDNEVITAFFGYDTPESRAKAKERIAAYMKKGGQSVWLKVVEQETGKIISGSWWMIYPNWVPSEDLTESAAAKLTVDYLEGEDKEKAEALIRDLMTRRARYTYGHPHVFLALLFTDSSYQRSGAGSLHIEWGVALADQLFLPWYVEGTPAGHRLYAKYGAKDLEKVRFEARSPSNPHGKPWINEQTVMRREPLKTAIRREAKN